ncbi:MAG TPA: hypothetical protein VIM79_01170 [Niastella sp.]
MKFIALVVVLGAFFTAPGYGQSTGGQESGEDIRDWLKPGEHQVELMSIKSTITPRDMALSNKVRKAMEKNAAWVRDSLATVTDSTIIYEKFGLTKAEFDEYLLASETKSTPELVKTGDETLVIKRKKNTLTFKGTGRLKVLDSLKFNVVLKEPIYNGKELDFNNKSGGEDNNNPFKSPWTGYHYSFVDLGEMTSAQPDPATMSATNITFDIGKIQSSGKTVIMFMLFKTVNGKMAQSNTVICFFE